MITLVPYAGLGNRIRCICSVHKYCTENKIDLKILWPKEKGFNATFGQLFENNQISVVEKSPWLYNLLFLYPLTHRLFDYLQKVLFGRRVRRDLMPLSMGGKSHKLNIKGY